MFLKGLPALGTPRGCLWTHSHCQLYCECTTRKQGLAGALYWNLRTAKGTGWEAAFRAKIESDLPSKDLIFLMGTVHRFPDQWLIASLIYPPKRQPGQLRQASLL